MREGSSQDDQPVAIFHAFDQHYSEVESALGDLASQGYSHVQIAPAQKSNPSAAWWARYQPVDYGVIEGRGSADDLRRMTEKAHECGLKVIGDVVFNHMAKMDEYADLNFPGISSDNFHVACAVENDGDEANLTNCQLGGLPDLDQSRPAVLEAHEHHLKMLIELGVDGFRFDAAKHMAAESLQRYVEYANQESHRTRWNYLELIEDQNTPAAARDWVAAVTDFLLYNSARDAFSYGGDLRSLRMARGIGDDRSVTFGRVHDNIRELNAQAVNPYDDPADSLLATAFVLAREQGTPLVFSWDAETPFLGAGVKFRRLIHGRTKAGAPTSEKILGIVDSDTVLFMERGAEGFFVVNKSSDALNVPTLDLTLTNLEGCYRELRNGFFVAIERRPDGRKYITRWGSSRGGLEIHGRDALYFVRESWTPCESG